MMEEDVRSGLVKGFNDRPDEIGKTREIPGVKSNTTILGHTKPTTTVAEQVNDNKIMEERILRRLDAFALDPETDKRWLAIGRTKIEEAFMAINRSLFKPNRVQGDL